MRDGSSGVCSSDLDAPARPPDEAGEEREQHRDDREAQVDRAQRVRSCGRVDHFAGLHLDALEQQIRAQQRPEHGAERVERLAQRQAEMRSEEHTSELQSLMRISYAVFCLKKKK